MEGTGGAAEVQAEQRAVHNGRENAYDCNGGAGAQQNLVSCQAEGRLLQLQELWSEAGAVFVEKS